MSDTQGENTKLFRCQEHGRLLGRVRKKPKGHRLQYERASKEHQQVVYTTSHCMSVLVLSSSGYIHIARADCLCRPDRHDNTASVQSFHSYKPRCMQQVEAAQSKSEKPMSCTQSRNLVSFSKHTLLHFAQASASQDVVKSLHFTCFSTNRSCWKGELPAHAISLLLTRH